VRCVDAESRLAYAGLADLLGERASTATAALPPPQRRAPEVAPLRAGPAGELVQPHAGGRAVAGVLRLLAGQAPLLIAIDDAQWLDAASAGALAFALRRLDGVRLGLLATWRATDGRPPPGPGEVMPARWHRLVLGPLHPDDLGGLVDQRFPRPARRSPRARVIAVAAGNRLSAIELMAAHLTAEASVEDSLKLPPRLEELLAGRLERLPQQAAEPLAAVASLATPAVALVAAALGADARAGLAAGADHRSGTARQSGRQRGRTRADRRVRAWPGQALGIWENPGMPQVDVADLIDSLAARAHWPYEVLAGLMNEAPEVLAGVPHAGVERLARSSPAVDAVIGLVDTGVLRAETSHSVAVLASGADPRDSQAASLIAHVSMQDPSPLAGKLDLLWDLQLNRGAYDQSWPWRSAADPGVRQRLVSLAESADAETALRARACLPQARDADLLRPVAALPMPGALPWMAELRSVAWDYVNGNLIRLAPAGTYHVQFPDGFLRPFCRAGVDQPIPQPHLETADRARQARRIRRTCGRPVPQLRRPVAPAVALASDPR
jgi:hypothetical protein